MRIDLATLDPSSTLAQRIAAATARDQAARAERAIAAPNLAAQRDLEPQAADQPRNGKRACGLPCEPESVLHEQVVRLLRGSALPGTFWTHFPAGEKRTEATGRKLARMGTKPGVPDFVLTVAGRALFLELKNRTGKLSAMQKTTHAALIRAGAEVAVVRSLDDARAVLAKWGAIA